MQGSEGQNVRLNQYARKIDAALRPILAGRDTPLVLAATDRLASIYRSVNSYPHLLEQSLGGNSERASDAELSVAVRAILDAWYQSELTQFRSVYETRADSGRATSDLSDAARAATFGAIDVLHILPMGPVQRATASSTRSPRGLYQQAQKCSPSGNRTCLQAANLRRSCAIRSRRSQGRSVQFSPPVPHDLKANAKQNERHQPRQHQHPDLAKPRDDGCRIAKD